MANTEIKRVNTAVEFKANEEGSIRALFSTFGVVDHDGDIVLSTAIQNGVTVPMVWAHDWSSPVGKGIVTTDSKGATFDGSFFLATTAGRDAYETVKAMGELQEYSWGFRVLESEWKSDDEYDVVRVITKAEIFEVSPVLKGAGIGTMTLAIKSGERLSFEDHLEAALAAVSGATERAKSLADLRAKEGRAISSARRTRMEEIAKQLRSGADELDAILAETAPAKSAPDAQPADVAAHEDADSDATAKAAQAIFLAEFTRYQARRLRVA